MPFIYLIISYLNLIYVWVSLIRDVEPTQKSDNFMISLLHLKIQILSNIMKITPKVRPAGKEHYYLFINVHDTGKYPDRIPLKGHKIKQKDWNPKGNEEKKNWIKTTANNHGDLNRLIDETLTKIKAEKLGLQPKDILEQRETKLSGGKKSFLKYAETVINQRRVSATAVNDTYAMKKLKEYLEDKDNVGLFFKEIDTQFVHEYYRWMLDSKLGVASANEYLNKFKAIYNIGLQDTSLKFDVIKNPFEKFKKEKTKKRNKGLSNEELNKFKDAIIPPNKPKWKNAHNMFMFQFWGAFRIKDVMLLKWKNVYEQDGELTLDFFTSKGHTRIVRTVLPVVQEYFVQSMERHYPGLSEQLSPIQKEIKELKDKMDNIQKENDGGRELSGVEVLKLLKSGLTFEEVTEQIEQQGNLKADLTRRLNELEQEIKKLLIEKLDGLSYDRPNEYIFYYGNEKGLVSPWKAGDGMEEKYKLCVTSIDSFLIQLQKLAKIRTHISSHVSRHTATGILMRNGMNPHATSAFLTHNSLKTTEIYRGTLGIQDNEVSDHLSKLL